MEYENNQGATLEAIFDNLINEDPGNAALRICESFDQSLKSSENRIVLFGAGGLGRKILSGLRKAGLEPLAFTDNNARLWNTGVDGVPVLSPRDAARKFGSDSTFIIAIWHGNGTERFSDRKRQLTDLGCASVISFGGIFLKYPDFFLPHAYLEAPDSLLGHSKKLRTLFHLWSDDESRLEYLAQLKFRLKFDIDALMTPAGHTQYFPKDLFDLRSDEVFLDCGAFDGDTLREFLLHQEKFSGKILAFEPDRINFRNLQEYISTLPQFIQNHIFPSQSPVGSCGQKVRFSSTGTISSKSTENGEVEMECICIDRHGMQHQPSFIKMDIEGAEVDALYGARETILNFRPILAVCVYHQPDHLWEIPLLIASFCDDYHFFLRTYDVEGWEIVCYAVPTERLKLK